MQRQSRSDGKRFHSLPCLSRRRQLRLLLARTATPITAVGVSCLLLDLSLGLSASLVFVLLGTVLAVSSVMSCCLYLWHLLQA